MIRFPIKHPEKLTDPTNHYIFILLCFFMLSCTQEKKQTAEEFELKIEQLTSGPKHHFFGYIGQCQTIPWNASGQYILGMEIDTISRMPLPDEAATIFIIDTKDNNKIIYLDKTYAWNPQQGTMFYWNPNAPETQFFFNDRDLETGKVFTVLYDVSERKRVKEYKYADTPIGNGGVAADGSAWLGLNYGRMARLRLVTGYPGTFDFSQDEIAPDNDGIFIVDVKTGEKKLLVSFAQIAEKIKDTDPNLHTGLFINHSLWNRNSDMVYFFARGGWDDNVTSGKRVNVPFSVRSDGTDLTVHTQFIGGHPEWDEGYVMFGSAQGEYGETRQVRYDVLKKEIIEYVGNVAIFQEPEGDVSLSPDANWFVNGYENYETNMNIHTVFRRSDGAFARMGVYNGGYTKNRDIRIDAAPRWNRTNDAILVPGKDKEDETRQMFVIKVIPKTK
tara:strand:- start:5587 stop:6918 length:1332 start_codon:yes stop_codon:yes gene_type:complete